MILNAKNENIQINGYDCDYISFGTGRDVLIMLPGVGDGFKTAKGVAVPFAMMYRCFAESFKVYVFSRRDPMKKIDEKYFKDWNYKKHAKLCTPAITLNSHSLMATI